MSFLEVGVAATNSPSVFFLGLRCPSPFLFSPLKASVEIQQNRHRIHIKSLHSISSRVLLEFVMGLSLEVLAHVVINMVMASYVGVCSPISLVLNRPLQMIHVGSSWYSKEHACGIVMDKL